jgi:glycerol-3-phosphate acyltransferase PlsY
MNSTALFVLVLVACYLLAAIPFGLLVTRYAGRGDIRAEGSGNIGATNVYRVAGRKLGVLTLLLDMLKGALPLWLCQQSGTFSDIQLAVIAVVLLVGHCFPVYLRFKGGKGVATALGIFAVIHPLAVVETLLLFLFIVWKSRYVSMGSVSAACIMPVLLYHHGAPWPFFAAALVIGGIVIVRHRANIERVLNGTESKLEWH